MKEEQQASITQPGNPADSLHSRLILMLGKEKMSYYDNEIKIYECFAEGVLRFGF
jgi:hypothetical protein